mgnify:CR=1 FL=1
MGAFLEDFIGSQSAVQWQDDRYFVAIHGPPSDALRRVAKRNVVGLYTPDRWIEVWFGKGTIYVITRRQDQFTSAIAEGIAAGIAGFWKGRREK